MKLARVWFSRMAVYAPVTITIRNPLRPRDPDSQASRWSLSSRVIFGRQGNSAWSVCGSGLELWGPPQSRDGSGISSSGTASKGGGSTKPSGEASGLDIIGLRGWVRDRVLAPTAPAVCAFAPDIVDDSDGKVLGVRGGVRSDMMNEGRDFETSGGECVRRTEKWGCDGCVLYQQARWSRCPLLPSQVARAQSKPTALSRMATRCGGVESVNLSFTRVKQQWQ